MIDQELWLIAVVRSACRQDGAPMPSIRRADELLDERNESRPRRA
ncbi:hypothetical protein ACP6C7_18820 [Mycolicibacterium septicum]|uniref:Uncharacterized protein n=1 Tax=Mycolicibacterium septicum TaxID=98668 RepID=A0ABW9LTU1_9MYCO